MEQHQLTSLINALRISSSQYSFEENSHGNIISIEIFEGEYEELAGFGSEIFTLLRDFPYLEKIEIDAENVNITQIDDLRSFKHLKSLSLECDCSISDISALSELPHLETVVICGQNPIEELPSFSKLYKLKSLYIVGTKVSDLSPLSCLKSLKFLGLSGALIKDLTPLQSLKQLESLNLNANAIESLDGVQGLSLLSHLSLQDNQIADIDSLKSLIKLKYLYLSNNKISAGDALRHLFKMEHLDLSKNEIVSIDFVERMQQLSYFTIAYNPVQSLFPIKCLPQLKLLNISGIKADTEVIKYCTALQWLYANDCGLNSIPWINHSANRLDSASSEDKANEVFIAEVFPFLQTVHLADNNISNISILPFLYAIKEINLANNPLGNKLYGSYLSQATVDCAPLTALQRLSAKVMLEEKKYDEALAYYYYHNPDVEALKIYVHKFCAIKDEDWFHLKYYFGRIIQSKSAARDKGEYTADLLPKVSQRVDTLNSYLKAQFQQCLDLDISYYNHNYLEDFQQLSEEVIAQKTLDSELYYRMATPGNMVKRSHLKNAFYYLKMLLQRKSHFAFVLSIKIRHCLRREFASTEQESAIQGQYMTMLRDIDQVDLTPEVLAFDKRRGKVDKEDPVYPTRNSSGGWGMSILFILLSVVIAIVLVYNNFFGFAGLTVMSILLVILIRWMFK